MKIIITEEQYNNLINGSIPDRVKKLIINYWENEKENNGEVLFDEEDLKYFGVNVGNKEKNELGKMFFDFVGEQKIYEFLDSLIGNEFSTNDFPDPNIGGYDFKWAFTQYEIDESKDRPYIYFWYKVLEGEVTLMMTETPDNTVDIFQAMRNKDYGWEIRYEINDVIQDCVEDLVLSKTGMNLAVIS
jgi:hypothetical protein